MAMKKSRKYKYMDVYYDENISALLKEALQQEWIRKLLVLRNLPLSPQGVARLAASLFLEDMNKFRVLGMTDRKAEQPPST